MSSAQMSRVRGDCQNGRAAAELARKFVSLSHNTRQVVATPAAMSALLWAINFRIPGSRRASGLPEATGTELASMFAIRLHSVM